MRLFGKRKTLNLALQGGGAHGAFTWGALDRLLEDDAIDIGWVSGTSAGAVNAAALAGGLAAGGRAGGRATLERVWKAVEAAGVPDLARLNPFLYGLAKSGFANLGGILSPYEFNPLGFDPLRKLLAAEIDFAAIRDKPGIGMLIAATDAASGRPRLFRRNEVTVEAVLASACLPQIHHAVQIDGRAYWDGGFSANPDIVTLAAESPAADTLLIQLNPLDRTTMPRTARDIGAQVNVVTFNQPLLRDIEMIVAAQEDKRGWLGMGRGRGRLGRLAHHRLHVIEAGRYTAGLSADSKTTPEKTLLAYLFNAGRTETARWLERHRRDIGRRQSVDLRRRFLDRPHEQLAPPPSDGEELAQATGSKI